VLNRLHVVTRRSRRRQEGTALTAFLGLRTGQPPSAWTDAVAGRLRDA
jgi:hypothetical protein